MNRKVAIVGCGGIAQVHARALSALEGAELCAFVDCKPERAEQMAAQYGKGRAKTYGSLGEMLTAEHPQWYISVRPMRSMCLWLWKCWREAAPCLWRNPLPSPRNSLRSWSRHWPEAVGNWGFVFRTGTILPPEKWTNCCGRAAWEKSEVERPLSPGTETRLTIRTATGGENGRRRAAAR